MINNSLGSSKISISPSTFAKLLDRMSNKIKFSFWWLIVPKCVLYLGLAYMVFIHWYFLIHFQILKRGGHVNDRDGLTDMTLLHYACKAGASGVGDIEEACRVISLLIGKGADLHIRCRWTNMASLHYATYFDIGPILNILLTASKAAGKLISFSAKQSWINSFRPILFAFYKQNFVVCLCILWHLHI